MDEFPAAKWDAILGINLSAAFHGIAAAVPQMKKQRWGRIVNIASAHGLVASTHKAAYVAAKHGLVGLTKVVGLETAGSGVTCNAVCPGWVRTPLVEKQISDIAAQRGISQKEATEELLVRETTVAGVCLAGAAWRHRRVPVLRCGRPDHRHRDLCRWRLDRAVAGRMHMSITCWLQEGIMAHLNKKKMIGLLLCLGAVVVVAARMGLGSFERRDVDRQRLCPRRRDLARAKGCGLRHGRRGSRTTRPSGRVTSCSGSTIGTTAHGLRKQWPMSKPPKLASPMSMRRPSFSTP